MKCCESGRATHGQFYSGKFWPVVILIVCFLVLSPAISADKNANSADLEEVTLQLKWHHQFQFAGYYAAVEKGYYRNAGLDVKIAEGGPFNTIDEALSSRADYGVATTEILVERLQGKPLVVLAAILQHSPQALMVRKSLEINAPTHLARRKVWISRGVRSAEFHAMFRNEGVSLDEIDFLADTMPDVDYFDESIDAFGVYTTNEPFLLQQKGIPISFIHPRTYGIDFYGDCLYTSEEELKRHPDRVRRFRQSSIKGWEYALRNPEEIIDIILNKYGSKMTREHLQYEAVEVRRLIMPGLVQVGHINPGRWQHIAETYARLKMVKPEFSLEGFIYDPDPRPSYTWLYWLFGIATSLLLLTALAAIALWLFSQKLRAIVKRRTKEIENSNQMLQESEKRYRSLFEDSPVSLWEVDFSQVKVYIDNMRGNGIQDFRTYFRENPDSLAECFAMIKIIDVNKATLELYKAKTKEQILSDFDMVFVEDSFDILMDDIAALTEGKFTFETESAAQNLEGERIWINMKRTVASGNEETWSKLLISAIEITERKEAEISLQESEEKHRTLIDSMSDGIHVVDENMRIVVSNPALQQWNEELDLERDAVGRELFEIFPFLSDTVREEYQQVFDNGEILVTEEINRLGDRDLVTETRKIPIFKKGKVSRVITVISDITERREMEEELRKSDKLESIGVLAGGIAHDFNNLLTGIMGNISLVEMLVETKRSSEEILAKLKAAERASMQARDLTQQLLTFSKGGAPILKATSIADLLRDSSNFVLSGSNVRCNMSIPTDLWIADIDEGQMSHVISNILINADQAMANGGTIEVKAENMVIDERTVPPLKDGRYVKISIEDHGIGILESDLPKIFDPYFTTKQAGSGLGLAICYSIVEKHDGYITAESRIGIGTTFHIYLPASQEQMAIRESNIDGKPIMGEGRILVMDDEEIVRAIAGNMLREFGYRPTFAVNGTEAIRLYRAAVDSNNPFDAVIVDLTIPGGMGGREAIQELIKLDPEVKAIVSSGYSNDPIMIDFKKYGFRDFIAKPYKTVDLSEVLHRVTTGDTA